MHKIKLSIETELTLKADPLMWDCYMDFEYVREEFDSRVLEMFISHILDETSEFYKYANLSDAKCKIVKKQKRNLRLDED